MCIGIEAHGSKPVDISSEFMSKRALARGLDSRHREGKNCPWIYSAEIAPAQLVHVFIGTLVRRIRISV